MDFIQIDNLFKWDLHAEIFVQSGISIVINFLKLVQNLRSTFNILHLVSCLKLVQNLCSSIFNISNFIFGQLKNLYQENDIKKILFIIFTLNFGVSSKLKTMFRSHFIFSFVIASISIMRKRHSISIPWVKTLRPHSRLSIAPRCHVVDSSCRTTWHVGESYHGALCSCLKPCTLCYPTC